MDTQTFLGLIARHGLTTVAGILVSHGYLSSSGTEQFIGAGMVFAGIAWSWWQKTGQAEVAAQLAKMKGPAAKAVLLIAAGALLAVAGEARAADIAARPVLKSPAAALLTGYPYEGSGLYWGISTLAEAADPTIGGQTATGLTAFGQGIGGVVGYQYGAGQVAYALELGGYYNNLGGNSNCSSTGACTINDRWSVVQRIKAMTPMSNLLGMFPTLNLPQLPALPTLPAGITASNLHPYLMVGLHEDDVSAAVGLATGREWQIAPSIGVGQLAQLSNKAALDVWAEYVIPGAGFAFGPATYANQGKKFLLGVSVLW